MSVLKRRSRMISFRVSEDEYTGLKNLCVHEGARSVSDMARDAVQRLITNHSSPHGHLETAVQELQGRIDYLDMEVKRLDRALNGHANGLSLAATAPARNGNGDL